MCSVETHSFLPNEQSDRRDLACQSKTRHRWFHSSGKACLVEVLERPACSSSPGGGVLEDIFQIMVMVDVESPDVQDLFRALALASNQAVLSARGGLHHQPAIVPELPL